MNAPFGKSWLHYFLALILAIFFAFPLVWMFYSSLKSNSDLINSIWSLPTNPSLDAYKSILETNDFQGYFINSLLITTTSVFLTTITAAMAGFALAKLKVPGGKYLLLLFLLGIMIPPHITLIPLYTMMRELGLLNELGSLLLPYTGFGLPVSIYILYTFINQVPADLEEAAKIDGATNSIFFWKILLPTIGPSLIAVAIINTINIWNEYLFSLTLVSGNRGAYPLPLGVYSLVLSFSSIQYNKAFSAFTLAALPLLVIFYFLQKRIIKSLATTL